MMSTWPAPSQWPELVAEWKWKPSVLALVHSGCLLPEAEPWNGGLAGELPLPVHGGAFWPMEDPRLCGVR